MIVKGQLKEAQYEVVSADVGPGKIGRSFYNSTTQKVKVDTGSVLKELGGGATATGSLNLVSPAGGPTETVENGLEVYEYGNIETLSAYASFTVPTTYSPGQQISLSGAAFVIADSTGNVFFRTETTLLRPETDSVTSTANQHTSTNTEVTLSGINLLKDVGSLDLTDASGEINSVAVAVGDVLSIRVYRDFTNETTPGSGEARLLKNSFEVLL